MLRVLYIFLCLLLYGVATSFAESPLADALENKDRESAQKLLRQKCDVNASQVDGMTPLHWAAYHDDAKVAQQLLDAGAKPGIENRYGVSPLYSACQNGNPKLVKALLKRGADPNTSLQGEEVLLTASRTGSAEVVKALIKRRCQDQCEGTHEANRLDVGRCRGQPGGCQRIDRSGS